jgi:hypothetical protein
VRGLAVWLAASKATGDDMGRGQLPLYVCESKD